MKNPRAATQARRQRQIRRRRSSPTNQRKGAVMSSSSIAGGSRKGRYPLLECPDCQVPLIRIISQQEHSKNELFVKCPNNVKGDSTTCGWIRSEEQYEAWFRKKEKEKQMQVHSPLAFVGEDVIGDLKQQLGEMKQTLDSVVSEIRRLKLQIGDKPVADRSPVADHSPVSVPSNSNAREELGYRKMQIVVDVSVVVGVLVGLLLGVVVAQMMK